MIDPTGMMGDYYDRDLNYIGSDGKNDGKYYYAEVDYRNIVPEGSGYVEIIHVKNTEEFFLPSAENQAIRALSSNVSEGVSDGFNGILKGIGNAPVLGLNGITGALLNNPVGSLYFQGTNPLEVPLPFGAGNAREESYMSAGSTGTLGGLGFGAGVFAGGASSLSVVPRTSFPPIKIGSTGGPTAYNKRVGVAVQREALAENRNNICVFCRQSNASQFEHAIASSRGGKLNNREYPTGVLFL